MSIVSVVLLGAAGTTAAPPTSYVRYSDVAPLFTAVADILPPELKNRSDAQRRSAWQRWIEGHDRDIRARLAQGDEDTIVNWLLFGTSFTSRPRALSDGIGTTDVEASRQLATLMRGRASDLVQALAAPGGDERRLFARRFLERKGFSVDNETERTAAANYLVSAIVRAGAEQAQTDRELEAAGKSGNAADRRAAASRLFRTRGLSLDTSLAPNYAVDQTLAALSEQGLLKRGAITRVAVIGPGLDFSDKDSGFDFYPLQTVQPFAALDSLRRLRLGPASGDPAIVLLDLSPRVIDHVTRAGALASRGDGYTLHLPLARSREWLPSFREYWRNFGAYVGDPAPTVVPTKVSELADLRAVRVPASVLTQVSAIDVNVVTERIENERFDLVLATNVFIYYDALDKVLALANVEAMLKPGGLLLSNTVMPELPASRLRLAGSRETLYWLSPPSDGAIPGSYGDRIWWYQRVESR